MSKFKILFIDDEPNYVQEYVEYLQEFGVDVKLETTAEGALAFIESHSDAVDAIVLDMMMPPGETYSAASTDDGLITGLRLYQDIREKCGPSLLITVLTNNTNHFLDEAVARDPAIHIFRKVDVFYDEFCDELFSLLITRSKPSQWANLYRKGIDICRGFPRRSFVDRCSFHC